MSPTGLARAALVALLGIGACGPDAPPPPVDRTPLTTATGDALLAEREAREARHAAPDAAAAPRSTASSAGDALTIVARLVDERADPARGAELARLVGDERGELVPGTTVRADAAGVVWLVLPRAELPSEGALELSASAPGRTTQRTSVAHERWSAGGVVNLGEWQLPAER